MANIKPPFVRSPGNYDAFQACEECCVKDFGPSLTQQSQAEDANINTIVTRFGLTGKLPEDLRAPVFADFDEVHDFKTAQDAIANANSAFMKMPAAIRARFDNDPQQFLEFCSDDANRSEAEKIGLVLPKAPESTPTGNPGASPTPSGEPPRVQPEAPGGNQGATP